MKSSIHELQALLNYREVDRTFNNISSSNVLNRYGELIECHEVCHNEFL